MKTRFPFKKHAIGEWLAMLLFSLCQLPIAAQQFHVKTFRQLPNDITAYIHPVRDLNQDACALIKVVGTPDFAFSTPLGIVKRRNDVGEIWLYIPHGSLQLTIKHPQWGVLRDYRFPVAIESRMTYELIIGTPIIASQPVIPFLDNHPLLPDTVCHRPPSLPHHATPRPKHPRERLQTLLMASVGFGKYNSSFGIRTGVMRRHGAYLLLQSDLRPLPDIQGECTRTGMLPGETGSLYYTGHTEEGRYQLLAGGIHRLWKELCLYEGIGYGKHTVAWETAEGKLLRNTAYSSQGVSMEMGGIYRFRKIVLSAGVSTIATKYWEAMVGFGVHF